MMEVCRTLLIIVPEMFEAAQVVHRCQRRIPVLPIKWLCNLISFH